jgi:hypothetical protein
MGLSQSIQNKIKKKAVTEMNIEAMEGLQTQLQGRFQQLVEIETAIRDALIAHTDGKKLKGNERVGWLGETYVKLLFGGKLVHDSLEHDVETPEGWRISVKARKGQGTGWQRTSAIPKIDGHDCPTHLAFVHLDNNYVVDKIWLYDWGRILEAGRFKEHTVRGEHRSYVFFVSERHDQDFLIYKVSKA